jgi:hypothetical protein
MLTDFPVFPFPSGFLFSHKQIPPLANHISAENRFSLHTDPSQSFVSKGAGALCVHCVGHDEMNAAQIQITRAYKMTRVLPLRFKVEP